MILFTLACSLQDKGNVDRTFYPVASRNKIRANRGQYMKYTCYFIVQVNKVRTSYRMDKKGCEADDDDVQFELNKLG
jgi:hypothetical protein